AELKADAAERYFPRQQFGGQRFSLARILIIRRPIEAAVGWTTNARCHRQIVIKRNWLRLKRAALASRVLRARLDSRGRELQGKRPRLKWTERRYKVAAGDDRGSNRLLLRIDLTR